MDKSTLNALALDLEFSASAEEKLQALRKHLGAAAADQILAQAEKRQTPLGKELDGLTEDAIKLSENTLDHCLEMINKPALSKEQVTITIRLDITPASGTATASCKIKAKSKKTPLQINVKQNL